MFARETIYKLARTSSELDACKILWAEHGEFGRPRKPGFPTIMAIRNEQLMGFLSTHSYKNAVVAGPMILNGIGGHSVFTVMRLIDTYERLLRHFRVAGYHFSVSNKNKQWLQILVKKIDMKPYRKDKTGIWFLRK